jgi:hypothetical protein
MALLSLLFLVQPELAEEKGKEEWEGEEENWEEKEGEEEKSVNPLVIRVEFLAKPWPHAVSWYSDLSNGTRLPLEDEAGLEYEQGGVVEASGGQGSSYQLATALTISNLTHNLREKQSSNLIRIYVFYRLE